MIAIVDYGVGNLFSLKSSFAAIGVDVIVTADPEVLKSADRIVLPGVGAFEDAAKKLRDSGLSKVLIELANNGKLLLGICLGMQMLFEKSFEYGEHTGLGLIPGDVVSMEPVLPAGYKVPHIGWNGLIFPKEKPKSKIFKYLKSKGFENYLEYERETEKYEIYPFLKEVSYINSNGRTASLLWLI